LDSVSSRHEAKYYKTALCVCVAVYELLTALLALELGLPEEEIPKHVCLTQYQFKAVVLNRGPQSNFHWKENLKL